MTDETAFIEWLAEGARQGWPVLRFSPDAMARWYTLDNTARALQAILAAHDPSRSWSVEVLA